MLRLSYAPMSCLAASALVLADGSKRAAGPSWLGVVRTVLMVLGGLVVIAIVLIVAVAVISGVMGMIGRARKGP